MARRTATEALFVAAMRRTRLDRLPSEPVAPALDALLASLRTEARLSTFGRIATRQDLARKLANLLVLDAREEADPSIAARPVTAPVFITGLPRSGTTFLHALLACNPAARVPLAWEVADPYGGAAGRRRFGRQLAVFSRLVPELSDLHSLSADAPQECTEILAHTFRSLRFDMTHDVPGYRAWLDRAGHDEAYRFHARFLRHLQGRRDGRWVLKSPDHVAALSALRRTYPDARLVMLHRDPLHVMASVARLTEVLRRPFSRGVDPVAIGRQVVRDWQAGLQTIGAVDDAVHVRHADLVADPVGTARLVCTAVGLPFDEAVGRRMATYTDARPRGGYGDNRYRLEDYGIEPAMLEPLRGQYLARFGVRREED